MRTFIGTAVAALVLLTACTSDVAPRDDDTAIDCPPELADALTAWGNAGFSGSVAVSTEGEFDCRAAFGMADRSDGTPNTPRTVFGIGSVSKSFTAAAIGGLVDDGRLALTDRAGDVVPGLEGPAAVATVEQLLLHTSGLTGSHGHDHEPLSRAEAIASISAMEQAFEPGTDHLYSNAGYTLLALIVEEAAEADFRGYLAAQVLALPDGGVAGGFWDGEPAASGPRAVGYLDGEPTHAMGGFDGPHWALQGNGDLAMTMPDLAAWTHARFTGQDDDAAEAPGWVAHDAAAYGQPFLTSSGGGGDIGHDVVVAWLPRGEQVIAVASNTPVITAGELLEAVGPALASGEEVPVPDTSAVEVDPAELAELAGRYGLASGGWYDVAARAGGLAITAHGTDAVAALFPRPDDVTPDVIAAHEEAVDALLDGATEQGREERALLESDIGEITDVQLAGTIVDDGELRTYVVVTAAGESLMLWYALDEHGGIAGAEGPVDPPTLLMVPSGDGRFRPDDPAGTGAATVVTFDEEHVTVTGPDGTATAGSAD